MMDALMAILVAACVSISSAQDVSDSTYIQQALVMDVRGEYITVEDPTGNYYQFRGEGYECGDIVSTLMDNKLTESVIDDEVIDACIVGHI